MVAPIRFLTGRQQQQKIGVIDSTENTKVLEVIGRVGIGTTVFEPTNLLDVRGDANISGDLTLGDTTIGADILSISGIATFTNTTDNVLGNSNTGSVQIDGGLGVDQNVTVGAALSVVTDLRVGGISTFQDNVHFYNSTRLKFGDDEHLEIYRVGNESFIHDSGPGGLSLSGANVKIENDTQDEDGLVYTSNAGVEIFHNGIKKFETTGFGATVFGGLNVSGVTTHQGDIYLGDNNVLRFGTGSSGFGDLQIYHDTQHSYVRDNGTGNLRLKTNNLIELVSGGTNEVMGQFASNAGVGLYYNGQKKFETTDGGIDVTGHTETDTLRVSGVSTFQGNVNLGDNDRILFDGTQLALYAASDLPTIALDGGSTNGGYIILNGGKLQIRKSAHDGEQLATFNVDGGIDLYHDDSKKFETTGIGVSISNGGTDTATIAGPENLIIDPAAVGDNTGLVRIKGDLYVDGTTTQINSTTIELADFVVGIATTATTDLLTDGAGIGIGSDKTFLYEHNSGTNPSLKSSENLNVASGKHYQIGETEVLSATTLGSGVVNSSLTSVGTLNGLTVSGIATATTFSGTLENDLTLGVSGTGLSGSATYNNSGAVTFTVTSDATSANTADTIVSRDSSGNFSAGTITANLTGTATTATNLADGANITTGTISNDRLPDLITSNINIASGISSVATLDATNATIDNVTFTSGTAITSVDTDLSSVSTSDDTLASAKAIKTYVDSQVTAQDLDFAGDTGTGDVDLDSEVLTIAGTASEIETSASGQTLTIGLPNEVAITTSLVVGSAVTITSSGINVPTGVITASSFVGSIVGSLTGIAATATALENPRDFSITGDFVTAPTISFDGTANVALAATITPNSIGLGTYTSGDYVQSITGTTNEIEVTSGTGEGSTPTIGLPNDVTISNDLTVSNNLNVSGVSTFQDNVYFGDNDVLNFGDGNDLQIYHTGSISYISDQGTGAIRVLTNQFRVRNAADTEELATFTENGSAALYYDASKKFETTGYGVTVTGGAYVSGISTFQDKVHLLDNDKLHFGGAAGDDGDLQIYHDGSQSYIEDLGVGQLYIRGSAAIHLENGGGTQKYARFVNSGAAELYHTGSKKFETTGYGVTVSGGAYVSGISTFQNNIEVTGTISVNDTTIVGSETASLSTVTETAIHTGLSASTYRSVEYNIQATQGTNYHVTKILALHNGTTAYHNEYGTIYNNTSVATFNVDVSGGNLRLLATSASASQTDYVVNFTATKI